MLNFNAPSNFKKGRLIASRFRIIDIVIGAIGIAVSIVLVNILIGMKLKMPWLLIAIIPAVIAVVLICPAGEYHNILVFLQVVIKFYTKERKYIWEGVYKDGTEKE